LGTPIEEAATEVVPRRCLTKIHEIRKFGPTTPEKVTLEITPGDR